MGGSSARHELLGSGALRAALLLALGLALYGNTLGNDLVWDDRLTAGPPGPAAWLRPSGDYYRPVVGLSLALDRALFGGAPAAFHLTNLLCHVAVAWLLGALALALGFTPGGALAAALVFLAHPVQTEAVTYVSGRTDVLCALFVLVALLAWRRARGPADRFAFATAAALALALGSKEAAVLVPLALLLPGAHPGAGPRPLLPIAVAGTWLATWALSGGPGLHLGGLGARLPAVAVQALTYARLLVLPLGLHLERFTTVPGWRPAAAAAAWALVLALGVVLVRVAGRVPSGALLLGLAVLTYAPVSGLVPVYPAIAASALFTAEHFLYLPLLGLAPLAVGAAAAWWPAGARRAAPAALAVLLAAWAAVVVDRNRDWRDEETLFRHTLAHDPPAARVWFNLGNHALAGGRLDEAERLYRAALARAPRDGPAHLNLGIALQRRGRRPEAEEQYRRALAADAGLAEAYRALAALLAARGEEREAAEMLGRMPHAAP